MVYELPAGLKIATLSNVSNMTTLCSLTCHASTVQIFFVVEDNSTLTVSAVGIERASYKSAYHLVRTSKMIVLAEVS